MNQHEFTPKKKDLMKHGAYAIARNRKSFLIGLLIVVPIRLDAKEQNIRLSEISLSRDTVYISAETANLFSPRVLDGLRRGMTAAVEYHIQCWKDRRYWINQLTTEKSVRMKVHYDSWDKRYGLTTRSGQIMLDEKEMIERCSRLTWFPLVAFSDLDPNARYTVGIRLIVQPMTMDNYEEIRRWLTGEAREISPKSLTEKESSEKIGGWFLGMVLNLTGFGEQISTNRRTFYTVQGDSLIIRE
ncbi:MAG TPA: DUF4390 domain-containing protein [bacterium]|nr:DUF4390 domain-containing protein [bacterium]